MEEGGCGRVADGEMGGDLPLQAQPQQLHAGAAIASLSVSWELMFVFTKCRNNYTKWHQWL